MTLNIFGVGTDIVKNSRIKKLIKNKKFINRIFTSSEIKDSKKINHKVLFFSKRFAAKEAFVKSLGTGFAHNINFIDKPYTRFKGTKFEQNTFFIEDPNGNVLELKTFE